MKALGILLIAGAVVLGVAGVLLSQRAVIYSSTALVKVARDQADLPELTGIPKVAATANVGVGNTFFIETEVAQIRSDAILNQVITQLSLGEVWGQRLNGRPLNATETSQLLKERLDVQPSDTDAIWIKAFSEVANEAAEIANAVAGAYCNYRADYRRRLAQNALDVIAGEYAEMEKRIAAGQTKVEAAWQQLDPTLQAMAATNSATVESAVLRSLHSKYSDSLLRYLTASNQLAIFRATNVADEVIEKLRSQTEKARVDLAEIENATASEMRRVDSLKTYQSARLDLEELNQRFAPVRNTVEKLHGDLRPQSQPPASITEHATASSTPDVHRGSPNKWMLPGAGVGFFLGVGLLFVGRNPPKKAF